jgi:hypothetical protein
MIEADLQVGPAAAARAGAGVCAGGAASPWHGTSMKAATPPQCTSITQPMRPCNPSPTGRRVLGHQHRRPGAGAPQRPQQAADRQPGHPRPRLRRQPRAGPPGRHGEPGGAEAGRGGRRPHLCDGGDGRRHGDGRGASGGQARQGARCVMYLCCAVRWGGVFVCVWVGEQQVLWFRLRLPRKGYGPPHPLEHLHPPPGVLTVGVVTYPFTFEGRRRSNQAVGGIDSLRGAVDSVIVVRRLFCMRACMAWIMCGCGGLTE